MGRTEQNKGRTETGEQIWEEEEAEPRAAEQLQVQRLRRAARAGRGPSTAGEHKRNGTEGPAGGDAGQKGVGMGR